MTRHTYKDVEFTISGIAAGTVQKGDVLAVSDSQGTYEATVTMTIPERDELDDLAWRSVVTPSLDASDALDVLADALLERGTIQEVDEEAAEHLEMELLAIGVNTRRLGTPREQAWEWARERTLPPLLDRIRALVSQFKATNASVSAITFDSGASQALEWVAPPSYLPPPRERRGIGNAPLAMRAKLKPWER